MDGANVERACNSLGQSIQLVSGDGVVAFNMLTVVETLKQAARVLDR